MLFGLIGFTASFRQGVPRVSAYSSLIINDTTAASGV